MAGDVKFKFYQNDLKLRFTQPNHDSQQIFCFRFFIDKQSTLFKLTPISMMEMIECWPDKVLYLIMKIISRIYLYKYNLYSKDLS